jgi:thiamine-phosphate pyrophosphorylase
LPWVCLVTDHTLAPGGYAALERVVAAALQGGVNVVQLREKALPAGELFELAVRLRRLTRDHHAALIVNDRLDVALAAEADGVHLGEAGLPVGVAREMCADLLVGRSVHGVPAAVEAERDGADYLILGTIFPSESHPGEAVGGPPLIRKVRARVKIPVVAIGGISHENAAQTISDGACGVAVIRAVLADQFPRQAAQRLVQVVEAAWPSAILHRGI